MIDSEKVDEIFRKCLYKDTEVLDGKPLVEPIVVEGIMNTYGLHPERVKKYETNIIDWLKDLPVKFRKNEGGGWSFLNACDTKDGDQWTGSHQRMEQLFVLGMAVGKAKILVPREMWGAFPGGMPYIMVDV